ncbi:LOW QUALITY PROTEIN: uncharacterized protein LOC134540673 [Bacillus rossius redtenbacheri]|uniref:LOW QUALITY PROTEIN: uncharacterized protein LOC134540673 n=1 Tax=Bacillus rossius redtenbacheri TaxID=93214 RepID=UPI002FDE167F
MVVSRSDAKRRRREGNVLDTSLRESPKRAKVHAQRKFAQGSSNPGSLAVTPVKDKEQRARSNGVAAAAELLPSKRPRTEDFLTFLCFRGTPLLPASLDLFSVASAPDAAEDDSASAQHGEGSTARGSRATPSAPLPRASRSNDRAGETAAGPGGGQQADADCRRRPSTAVQALRRKYQEQRLAKQKAATLRKLAQKVKGKNMIRTRSSTLKEQAAGTPAPTTAGLPPERPGRSAERRKKLPAPAAGRPADRRGATRGRAILQGSPRDAGEGRRRAGLRSGSAPLAEDSAPAAAHRGQRPARFPDHAVRRDKDKMPVSTPSDFSSDDDQPLAKKVRPAESGSRKVAKRIVRSARRVKSRMMTRSRVQRAGGAEEPAAPRLPQARPTRKTKEAAALYMELLGKKLANPDADLDDDSLSLDSFPELPNARQNERRENELKANAMKLLEAGFRKAAPKVADAKVVQPEGPASRTGDRSRKDESFARNAAHKQRRPADGSAPVRSKKVVARRDKFHGRGARDETKNEAAEKTNAQCGDARKEKNVHGDALKKFKTAESDLSKKEKKQLSDPTKKNRREQAGSERKKNSLLIEMETEETMQKDKLSKEKQCSERGRKEKPHKETRIQEKSCIGKETKEKSHSEMEMKEKPQNETMKKENSHNEIEKKEKLVQNESSKNQSHQQGSSKKGSSQDSSTKNECLPETGKKNDLPTGSRSKKVLTEEDVVENAPKISVEKCVGESRFSQRRSQRRGSQQLEAAAEKVAVQKCTATAEPLTTPCKGAVLARDAADPFEDKFSDSDEEPLGKIALKSAVGLEFSPCSEKNADAVEEKAVCRGVKIAEKILCDESSSLSSVNSYLIALSDRKTAKNEVSKKVLSEEETSQPTCFKRLKNREANDDSSGKPEVKKGNKLTSERKDSVGVAHKGVAKKNVSGTGARDEAEMKVSGTVENALKKLKGESSGAAVMKIPLVSVSSIDLKKVMKVGGAHESLTNTSLVIDSGECSVADDSADKCGETLNKSDIGVAGELQPETKKELSPDKTSGNANIEIQSSPCTLTKIGGGFGFDCEAGTSKQDLEDSSTTLPRKCDLSESSLSLSSRKRKQHCTVSIERCSSVSKGGKHKLFSKHRNRRKQFRKSVPAGAPQDRAVCKMEFPCRRNTLKKHTKRVSSKTYFELNTFTKAHVFSPGKGRPAERPSDPGSSGRVEGDRAGFFASSPLKTASPGPSPGKRLRCKDLKGKRKVNMSTEQIEKWLNESYIEDAQEEKECGLCSKTDCKCSASSIDEELAHLSQFAMEKLTLGSGSECDALEDGRKKPGSSVDGASCYLRDAGDCLADNDEPGTPDGKPGPPSEPELSVEKADPVAQVTKEADLELESLFDNSFSAIENINDSDKTISIKCLDVIGEENDVPKAVVASLHEETVQTMAVANGSVVKPGDVCEIPVNVSLESNLNSTLPSAMSAEVSTQQEVLPPLQSFTAPEQQQSFVSSHISLPTTVFSYSNQVSAQPQNPVVSCHQAVAPSSGQLVSAHDPSGLQAASLVAPLFQQTQSVMGHQPVVFITSQSGSTAGAMAQPTTSQHLVGQPLHKAGDVPGQQSSSSLMMGQQTMISSIHRSAMSSFHHAVSLPFQDLAQCVGSAAGQPTTRTIALPLQQPLGQLFQHSVNSSFQQAGGGIIIQQAGPSQLQQSLGLLQPCHQAVALPLQQLAFLPFKSVSLQLQQHQAVPVQLFHPYGPAERRAQEPKQLVGVLPRPEDPAPAPSEREAGPAEPIFLYSSGATQSPAVPLSGVFVDLQSTAVQEQARASGQPAVSAPSETSGWPETRSADSVPPAPEETSELVTTTAAQSVSLPKESPFGMSGIPSPAMPAQSSEEHPDGSVILQLVHQPAEGKASAPEPVAELATPVSLAEPESPQQPVQSEVPEESRTSSEESKKVELPESQPNASVPQLSTVQQSNIQSMTDKVICDSATAEDDGPPQSFSAASQADLLQHPESAEPAESASTELPEQLPGENKETDDKPSENSSDVTPAPTLGSASDLPAEIGNEAPSKLVHAQPSSSSSTSTSEGPVKLSSKTVKNVPGKDSNVASKNEKISDKHGVQKAASLRVVRIRKELDKDQPPDRKNPGRGVAQGQGSGLPSISEKAKSSKFYSKLISQRGSSFKLLGEKPGRGLVGRKEHASSVWKQHALERKSIFQRSRATAQRPSEPRRAVPSADAFSPEDESSVYAFRTEPELPPVSTPFRRRARDSRASSTATSRSEEDLAKALDDELPTAADAPEATRGSASIAVQVNLDSETSPEPAVAVLEPPPPGPPPQRSSECSTQTEVPEEDDGDGHLFYIPLQRAGDAGARSAAPARQLIQGVTVKLGTEGAAGSNQCVIMRAKLVTKPPSFGRAPELQDAGTRRTPLMPQHPRPSNILTVEQKFCSAAVPPLVSTSGTYPPVGTVQPTARARPPRRRAPRGARRQGRDARRVGQRLADPGRDEPPPLARAATGRPLPRSRGDALAPDRRPSAEQAPSSSAQKSTAGSFKRGLQKSKAARAREESHAWSPASAAKFPSVGGRAQLVEAPTYRPTEREFQDPLEYIDKIRPVAEKFGLCRIVPPSTFKPECKVTDDMRFTAYNQYVHKMLHRWGPSVMEMAAIKKYLATQSISLLHPPLIGGMEVDLPRLYQTVQSLGGLKDVIERKKWQRVAEGMRIPKSAQERASKLDDIYCKYLLPYDTLSPAERSRLFAEVEREWQAAEGAGSGSSRDGSATPDTAEEEPDDAGDESQECIVKGRSMPLNAFYRIARNTMSMWFRQPEPAAAEVEQEFWRHVMARERHVCVHAGSIDSSGRGYGFPVSKNSPFARHPWNLKVLTNHSGSVLRSMGPVMGVTVPTLHVGMVFTTCCWYRDPHGLPWIEYLHTGARKIWYGIPDEYSFLFRAALSKLVPRYCRNKTIWLPSDTAMVPPSLLVKEGVSLCRTVQEPGQFILVFPRAFTSSICAGYLVSESVYFAQPSWLTTAEQVFKDIQESCEPSVFSLERLLFSIATDSRSHVDVLKQVLPMVTRIRQQELDRRKELLSLGLKSSERLPLPEPGARRRNKPRTARDDDGDYECEICRANLFVSLVTNSHEEGVYCLPHAVQLLSRESHHLKFCKLMYTYDQSELNELVRRLEERIEAKSQRRPMAKHSSSGQKT